MAETDDFHAEDQLNYEAETGEGGEGDGDEADIGDLHTAIYRFTHIVNRQCGDRDRGQCFHLNAGLARDLTGRGDINGVSTRVDGQFYFRRGEGKGMA